MAFDESERDDLLDRLVEEFAARLRRGERPALKEYADRYPELADEIRELFPAMVEVEQAKEICHDWDEAEQESLGRRVALKVLSAGSLLDPKQVRRFEREARAAARLHHTNIVPVFGVGESEGIHYYVMQFIPGLGLDAVLDRRAHV